MRACVGIIALLWVSAAVYAQEALTPRIKGLRAGLGLNSLVGSDAEEVGARADFVAGVFAAFALAKLGVGDLAFQLELLYARRSTEQEIRLGGGGYDLHYDLAFGELPLMLCLVMKAGTRPVVPYVGVVPGLRVGGKVEQSIPNAVPRRIDASLQSFALGLLAGIGTEFSLRRSARLFLDGRLQLGLTSILKDELKPPLREERPIKDLRLFAITLMAGIGF
ncbi:MAG: PorT family protein [Candidatus Kapabacteria bacterium]|nr:PorT family protein [Candidatus Kapabacteria bacterium]MDW8224507.1 outer membrane beta-barrel protein [Bacteroidota bacterium]